MPKSTRMTHNGDWVWRSDRDRHSASLIDLGVHWTGEWPICLGVSSRAFNEQIGIRKIALLARSRKKLGGMRDLHQTAVEKLACRRSTITRPSQWIIKAPFRGRSMEQELGQLHSTREGKPWRSISAPS